MTNRSTFHDINFTGSLLQNGSAFAGSPWTTETSPDALNYTSGNVGIGAADPGATLEVTGNAYVSSNVTVDTNTFHVDAVNNKVGVGTTTPQKTLEVAGPMRITDGLSNVCDLSVAIVASGWSQEAGIQASDKQASDRFGYSVSMNSDGTKVIVGAYYEDTGGSDAGAAYIFGYDGSSWSQEAKIQSSDKQASDRFGWEVSMSGDGTKAVVGAYREDAGGTESAGSAYIFALSSGSWSQQAKIQASDKQTSDYFGYAVSINSDGTKVIVGVYREDTGGSNAGAAYIYDYNGSSWSQEAKIQASDKQSIDGFGYSVDISEDGTRVIAGAYGENGQRGAGYIFALSGGSWSQEAKIVASDAQAADYLGVDVSMNGDGTKVVKKAN